MLQRGGTVGVRRERAPARLPTGLDVARADRDADRALPCGVVRPRDTDVVEALDPPRRGDREDGLVLVVLGEPDPRDEIVTGVDDGAAGVLEQGCLVPGMDECAVGTPERSKGPQKVRRSRVGLDPFVSDHGRAAVDVTGGADSVCVVGGDSGSLRGTSRATRSTAAP